MVEHNKRVLETLNRYIGLGEDAAPAPHYAVMINGEWGCGKSYFIREKWLVNFIDNPKYSVILVSLFGITSVEAIKENIAQSLVLNNSEDVNVIEKSKGFLKKIQNTKLISFIDKGLTSTFGVGFKDLTSLIIKDWLTEQKSNVTKILIFEDLERSILGLDEVFGFVSEHLENSSLRVIFISNDNRIGKTERLIIKESIVTQDKPSKKENEETTDIDENEDSQNILTIREVTNDKDYLKIREKVIGETVTLEVDMDEAVKYFLLEMKYSIIEREYLLSKIKDIMLKLEYVNLRVVRQALFKLKPLIDLIKSEPEYKNYSYDSITINGEMKEKQDYIFYVSELFIVVFLQKSMGDLCESEIEFALLSYSIMGTSVLKAKIKKKMTFESLFFKQPQILVPLHDANFELWVKYIWAGELDVEKVSALVKIDMLNIVPIVSQDNGALLMLHSNYWDYTKDEFDSYLNTLLLDLERGVYTDLVDLIAAYALLVNFEIQGLLNEELNLDVFFDSFIDKIDINYIEADYAGYRKRVNKLKINELIYKGYNISIAPDPNRILKFFRKLKDCYASTKEKVCRIEVNQLINNIITKELSIDDFYNKLSSNKLSIDNDDYIEVSILDKIQKEKLWQMLDEAPMNKQRWFFRSLLHRYDLDSQGVEEQYLVYEPEKVVLEELVNGYTERLNKAKEYRDNKIGMYKFLVADAISTLEGFEKKMELGIVRLQHNIVLEEK